MVRPPLCPQQRHRDLRQGCALQALRAFIAPPCRKSQIRLLHFYRKDVALTTPWDVSPIRSKSSSNVVSLLDYRISDQTVIKYVQQLYADRFYPIGARLAFTRHRNEFSAQVDCPRVNGFPIGGKISCGNGTYLFARLVKEVKLTKDRNGREQLTWQEIPLPEYLP